MTRISLTKAGIKPSLWRKIKAHALGSFYRLNIKSADLYTFWLTNDGDFGGGWSWLDTPSTWDSDLAVNLQDGKLYQL
jgi:hypothetical protein